MDKSKIELIKNFKIYKIGYDFLGYSVNKNSELNYHHLIVPKRLGGLKNYQNGAIIKRTDHDYLHKIERFEEELFKLITYEMIDMKNKGYLDRQNLKQIHEMLKYFEVKYRNGVENSGKKIIKDEYINERVRFD